MEFIGAVDQQRLRRYPSENDFQDVSDKSSGSTAPKYEHSAVGQKAVASYRSISN